ncbi:MULTISPECIES: hypothetical protein [Streptomyces]|uniref:Enoyl reductase n=1 Tax=Streptomyces doudnae TaxID=3075536 RepID=A0ABD5EY86_9ACTN|nr:MULTISPECIES: hypothetical protein [unclassified Streptomyces]MDT0439275.1 hypothetical protein [Streptomyces sp. DSM 41981]MYQ63446.1 hypothetical protein [Streptomyces sp. SID4950]
MPPGAEVIMLRPALRTAVVIGLLAALGTGFPANAGETTGGDSGTTEPDQPGDDSGGDSGKGSIGAHVRISRSGTGSGRPTTPATSADVDWKPPACWYEPMYTPDEYEKFIKSAYTGAREPAAGYARKRAGQKYHKGDKGLWWQVQFRDEKYSSVCPVTTDNWEIWVPPVDPAPDPHKLTPEILSELAYNATVLPTPPVVLKPGAGRLVVNLGTRVTLDGDFGRVWTTAALDHKGVRMAATTVATPVALRVDAGTADADPRSCTYDLVERGGGYTVDSAGAGCEVTYRRSSGDAAYPFRASITWKVTWTDSADPDGPARAPGLPDGLSTVEQDVTVREIQALNRARVTRGSAGRVHRVG